MSAVIESVNDLLQCMELYSSQILKGVNDPYCTIGSAQSARKLIETVFVALYVHVGNIDPIQIAKTGTIEKNNNFKCFENKPEINCIIETLGNLASQDEKLRFSQHLHYQGKKIEQVKTFISWNESKQNAFDITFLVLEYNAFLKAVVVLAKEIIKLNDVTTWNLENLNSIARLMDLSSSLSSEIIEEKSQKFKNVILEKANSEVYKGALVDYLCDVQNRIQEESDIEFYSSFTAAINRKIAELYCYFFLLRHGVEFQEIKQGWRLNNYVNSIQKMKSTNSRANMAEITLAEDIIMPIQNFGNHLEHLRPQYALTDVLFSWYGGRESRDFISINDRLQYTNFAGSKMVAYISGSPLSMSVSEWTRLFPEKEFSKKYHELLSQLRDSEKARIDAEGKAQREEEILDAVTEMRQSIERIQKNQAKSSTDDIDLARLLDQDRLRKYLNSDEETVTTWKSITLNDKFYNQVSIVKSGGNCVYTAHCKEYGKVIIKHIKSQFPSVVLNPSLAELIQSIQASSLSNLLEIIPNETAKKESNRKHKFLSLKSDLKEKDLSITKEYYEILHYVSGKRLLDYLDADDSVWNFAFALDGLICVLNALRTLHLHNLYHGDVSEYNIIVNQDGAVLIDIDSINYSNTPYMNIKTISIIQQDDFNPPEVSNSRAPIIGNHKIDVYHAGRILKLLWGREKKSLKERLNDRGEFEVVDKFGRIFDPTKYRELLLQIYSVINKSMNEVVEERYDDYNDFICDVLKIKDLLQGSYESRLFKEAVVSRNLRVY